MYTKLHATLALELAAAKAIDAGWVDDFEDSRILNGACSRATAEHLAAGAPSGFLRGWLTARVAQMLVERR